MGVMIVHKCKEGEPEYWLPNGETSSGKPVSQQCNRIEIKGMDFWSERKSRGGVKSDDTAFFISVLCLWAS